MLDTLILSCSICLFLRSRPTHACPAFFIDVSWTSNGSWRTKFKNMKATSFVVAPKENFPLSLFAKTTNFLGQNEIPDLSLTQHQKKSAKVFLRNTKVQRFQKKISNFYYTLSFFQCRNTFRSIRSDSVWRHTCTIRDSNSLFSIILDSAKLVVATLALNKMFRTFVSCNAVLKQ